VPWSTDAQLAAVEEAPEVATTTAEDHYIVGYALHKSGRGVKQDKGKAVKQFQRALALEPTHPAANFALGRRYKFGEGGLEKDAVAAVRHWQLAADGGDIAATFDLAISYETGDGCTQDEVKATALYTTAAAAGHPTALHNLGLYYRDGWGGLSIDFAAAAGHFQRGMDAGDGTAASELGKLYMEGACLLACGVPMCAWRAKMYTMGCRLRYGHVSISDSFPRPTPPHCFTMCALVGNGVEQDALKAVACYARSEELGGHSEHNARLLKERRATANAAAHANAAKELASVKNPTLAAELEAEHTNLFMECNTNPPGSLAHSASNSTFTKMAGKAKDETIRLAKITTARQQLQLTNPCVPLLQRAVFCVPLPCACVCVRVWGRPLTSVNAPEQIPSPPSPPLPPFLTALGIGKRCEESKA
jgi:TPR repeat protein